MLRKAGANLTEVIAYRTAGPERVDATLMAAIRNGQADAVTFFSPSAFREFQNLMGLDVLAKWNVRAALAAVGPVTAEAMRGAGLPVAIEADEATTDSLVAALERHFAVIETGRGGTEPESSNGRRA